MQPSPPHRQSSPDLGRAQTPFNTRDAWYRQNSPWGTSYATTRRYGYPPPRVSRLDELERRINYLEFLAGLL